MRASNSLQLSDLPMEIGGMILDYLPFNSPAEVIRVASVSRFFSKLVKNKCDDKLLLSKWLIALLSRFEFINTLPLDMNSLANYDSIFLKQLLKLINSVHQARFEPDILEHIRELKKNSVLAKMPALEFIIDFSFAHIIIHADLPYKANAELFKQGYAAAEACANSNIACPEIDFILAAYHLHRYLQSANALNSKLSRSQLSIFPGIIHQQAIDELTAIINGGNNCIEIDECRDAIPSCLDYAEKAMKGVSEDLYNNIYDNSEWVSALAHPQGRQFLMRLLTLRGQNILAVKKDLEIHCKGKMPQLCSSRYSWLLQDDEKSHINLKELPLVSSKQFLYLANNEVRRHVEAQKITLAQYAKLPQGKITAIAFPGNSNVEAKHDAKRQKCDAMAAIPAETAGIASLI